MIHIARRFDRLKKLGKNHISLVKIKSNVLKLFLKVRQKELREHKVCVKNTISFAKILY
jgi:hypothetical protein